MHHGGGGGTNTNAVSGQLRDLARYLNTLASETSNKSRSLEASLSSLGSTTEYSSSGTPGRSAQELNERAARSWRGAGVQKSSLLSGPSYLSHVPGSQYCITAGLHHHHHVRRTRTASFDPTWFLSMEQRLSETSKLLEGIAQGFGCVQSSCQSSSCCSSSCCCDSQGRELYRVKFALLVQKLEELRQAYLAGNNADALAAAQAELARLRREMEQKLAELQAQHFADIQKFSQERLRFDAERAQWEIERQRLLAELDALRGRPADHGACESALESLRRRIGELERELAEKNRRIADLEREKLERIRVVVKQDPASATVPRNPAVVARGDSIWGSGAVNAQFLGSHSSRPVVEQPSPAVMVTDMHGNPIGASRVEVALQKPSHH